MIACTDCKRELEEDDAVQVEYQVTTKTGVELMAINVPLCIDCTVRRERSVIKQRKKRDSVR